MGTVLFIKNNILVQIRNMFKIILRSGLLILFFVWYNTTIAQSTVTEYNNQAKSANAKGDYDGVIKAATAALNIQQNGESFWWRAIGNAQKQNYSMAISDASKAMLYFTNNKASMANLYELRATAKKLSNEFSGAYSDYKNAIDNGYTINQKIYEDLAYCTEVLGKYKESIEFYQQLIKLNNDNNNTYYAHYLYKLASLKYTLGEYNNAEFLSDLNTSIKIDNWNYHALYSRGQIFFQLEKFDSARLDFNDVITILDGRKENGLSQGFSSTEQYLQLCYMYHAEISLKLKKYSEAKEVYLKLAKTYPNYHLAYVGLSNIGSVLLDNYYETSGYFQKAISLAKNKSDQVTYYESYYLFERKSLQYTKALDLLNTVITNYPDQKVFYWEKASLLNIKKQYSEAIETYTKVIGMFEKTDSLNLSSLYLQRGQIKMKNRDINGALFDIQNSIAFKPGYDNYKALGDIFKIGMKQTELANGNYSKAMSYTVSGAQKKDTTSDYAYAAAAMGDKVTAERFIKKMIINASAKIGALAGEYHNAACIYTTLGNFSKAFEYLELSLQAGYTDFEHMLHDADLEPLYKLSEYKNLLVKYKVPVPVY